MPKKMQATWNLRELMEAQCLHSTSDLVPKLAERGVVLSRIQVYRLVTQPPQRVSMDLLAALCDIFSCTPNDLITITAAPVRHRRAVNETTKSSVKPVRVRVRRPT